jgi:two-component system sensor histidine kinase VicK
MGEVIVDYTLPYSSDPETKMFIDVIHSPPEIEKRYRELVASAKEQVLLFLPTARAYRREEKIGIFKTLWEAAARGVDVKVLCPAEEKTEEKMRGKTEIKQSVRIRNIKTIGVVPTEARSKILVIDRRHYLVVELKDDSKEGFAEAVGSAIFSNSKSTVLSYITMFDSLWRQSELYEKLEAHDKMQKEFINIAAHELRTPTQSILGFSELLRDTKGKDTDYMLNALTRNAYRLHTLITDILDASRIEGGTLKLNRDNVNLIELINTVIADGENQVKASGKSIKISHCVMGHTLGGEEKNNTFNITIDADKDRILQVLSNLVNNAIKFTKEGKIDIITEKRNNEVTVRVIDSGSGIDREIFPKLFEKFASKSDKGTGLGLFISKNIIEAHGGRIRAENNSVGAGATFEFTLPLGT